MKTGVVKALNMSGPNNQVLKNGDKVSEAHFPAGRWPELVAEGWITEDPEEEETAGKEVETVETSNESTESEAKKGKGKK